jgi:ferredoxin/flavodoxin---NADP+ reductase
MAKVLEYNATLTGRIDLEPTLAIFRARPDEIKRRDGSTHGPWFVPGQYLTIGMNREVVEGEDDPRPLSVRRPMSIASAPEDEDEVEFYIRYVNHPESDLPLTHVMWPIEVGARMYVRAVATGKFTLRDTVGEDDRRLKVMVAAGTGLAPFISIARSRLRQDPDARLDDLAILHGASYPSSLGYREELEAMARDHGLRYLPTVSRPGEADDWRGATGRVEALFQPDRLADTEARLGLSTGDLRPENAAVLICGLQGTIANTILHLNSRGYVPDNRRLRRVLEVDDSVPSTIFWEQYDTTPVLDVKDEALMKRLRDELHAALG